MTQKLANSTIHQATVLQAFAELKRAGNDEPTTAQVGEVLLRPMGFDMGGKLQGLAKSTKAYIIKNGNNNAHGKATFTITEAGEKYLANNLDCVQEFGDYELKAVDRKVQPVISGAAATAMAELESLISNNAKVKAFMINLQLQIEEFLEELNNES